MGSYNKINGKYVYEQKHLLTEKLRDEWGFKGFVVSDWMSTHSIKDTAACLNAGFTLEMPKKWVYHPDAVKAALENGQTTEDILNENIRRLLRVQFYVGLYDSEDRIPAGSRNTEEHVNLAHRIGCESAVLLKNENNILPLEIKKITKICIKGPLRNHTPFMSLVGGSSAVKPPYWSTPLNALKEKLQNRIEIVKKPEIADVVIIITGITQWYYGDSEGMDKKRITLSKKKIKQIKKCAKRNSNIIVVLFNGGPLAMSEWIDDVPAILEVWQPHQEGGRIIVDLLFGDSYPSGKLPTTFPKALTDSPAHKTDRTYPKFHYSYIDMIRHEMRYVVPKKAHKAKPIDIHYDEGIYVGYRYFDKNNIDPLFPFGYGLSYTEFEYSNVKINKKEAAKGEKIELSMELKNVGEREGAEIVQIYAKKLDTKVDRPPQELIGFSKVYLSPKEGKTITMSIETDDLCYYDAEKHQWTLEPGEYKLLLGTSSRDIRLETSISIK